jgi:isoleucyl-tRNA synthetase
MREIDRYMLLRADALVEKSLHHYERFEFHRFYQAIYNFATVELSSFYFDIIKDVLYTSAPNWKARRSAQTALYRITHAMLRLMAPLLTFTAEEAWGTLPKQAGDPDSIHLALFPKAGELAVGGVAATAQWDELVALREPVMKQLEEARQQKVIGSGLEARLVLTASGAKFAVLMGHESELAALFIVSQVELAEGDFAVEVHKADGTKCDRCWKFTKDVGSSAEYPTVCANCASALTDGLADGAWGEAKVEGVIS